MYTYSDNESQVAEFLSTELKLRRGSYNERIIHHSCCYLGVLFFIIPCPVWDGLNNELVKAGVNVKAALTSFNTAFLPISRSPFKQR